VDVWLRWNQSHWKVHIHTYNFHVYTKIQFVTENRGWIFVESKHPKSGADFPNRVPILADKQSTKISPKICFYQLVTFKSFKSSLIITIGLPYYLGVNSLLTYRILHSFKVKFLTLISKLGSFSFILLITILHSFIIIFSGTLHRNNNHILRIN